MAGLALILAKPMEATAQGGVDQGDGARWLERRPKVEREGDHEERVSGGGKLGQGGGNRRGGRGNPIYRRKRSSPGPRRRDLAAEEKS